MSDQKTASSDESSTFLGRLFHRIVCVCTAGFVYPNAFIEGMNTSREYRESIEHAAGKR